MEIVISFSLGSREEKLQRQKLEPYKGEAENAFYIDLIKRGLLESRKRDADTIRGADRTGSSGRTGNSDRPGASDRPGEN